MILIIRRDKVAMLALVFALLIAIYSLGPAMGSKALEVVNNTSQKIVVLDPGHGGEDPGATSDYSGISEKNINLYIAQRVKEQLEAEGFKVVMTRQEDALNYKEGTKGYNNKRMQDLTGRKRIIDESGASIAVSIHLNKFGQTQYSGAQTFFPPRSPESKTLAECLQKSLKEIINPENKREALVKSTELIILRNVKVPTVIVECGFLSNREEEQKLATKEYQDKLAYAIKEGIKKYFEE